MREAQYLLNFNCLGESVNGLFPISKINFLSSFYHIFCEITNLLLEIENYCDPFVIYFHRNYRFDIFFNYFNLFSVLNVLCLGVTSSDTRAPKMLNIKYPFLISVKICSQILPLNCMEAPLGRRFKTMPTYYITYKLKTKCMSCVIYLQILFK